MKGNKIMKKLQYTSPIVHTNDYSIIGESLMDTIKGSPVSGGKKVIADTPIRLDAIHRNIP